MKQHNRPEVSSFFLHIFATSCMLCDHLWGTVVSGNEWLTCIGRLAFPIFAFMIAEGYEKTNNLKKYALRLFLVALLSEIPFNLAVGGRLFYPVHQNVLWTFLIAIWLMRMNDKARESGKLWLRIVAILGSLLLATILGLLTMVDYFHAGILTVLVFHFLRGRRWYHKAGQLVCLAYINLEMLGGLVYEFSVLNLKFSFPQQGFALLALIPIWLYRGKQGLHNRFTRYLFYGFYPAHLLILGLLRHLI